MLISESINHLDIYTEFLEQLIASGKLSDNDLSKVRRMLNTTQDDSLAVMLIRLGICSEQDIAHTFSTITKIDLISANNIPNQAVLPESVSVRFLKQYHLVGVDNNLNTIVVAVVDPLYDYVVHALRLATNSNIILKIAHLSDIDAALEHQYGEGKSEMARLMDDLNVDDDSNEDLEHLKDLAS